MSRAARFALGAFLLLLLCGSALQREIVARRAGDWRPVQREDLVLGSEVTGELEATATSEIGPPQVPNMWEFKIAMLAPEGEDVKAGQPVLAFDTSELQRERAEKQAEAQSAKAEIDKKRADLALRKRDEELRLADAEARLRKTTLKLDAPAELAARNERRSVQIEHDTANKEIRFRRQRLRAMDASAQEELLLLRARYASASGRVKSIDASIAQLTVKAPRDGAVVYVTNWRGEKKKVGDSCWVGEKVLQIPDLTRLRARGQVDEVDAGRVQVGQRVTLRLDAFPDDELQATVREIGRTVQKPRNSTSPAKVLTTIMSLDRIDVARFRPGMRFQGTLEVERIRKSLVVPVASIFTDEQGPYVVKRGLIGSRRTRVKIGRTNGELAEISSGVAAGDRVLLQTEPAEEKS